MSKRNYKKFVFIFLISIPVFLGLNYFIWVNFTEQLLTKKHGSGGDLARTGYICDSKQFRRDVVELPRKHITFKQLHGQPIDVLTIGDSFSNGGEKVRTNITRTI